MRLDRFATPGKKTRFSIIDNRTGEVFDSGDLKKDFFVILLKDHHAVGAAQGYAKSAAEAGDVELAQDVGKLAEMAKNHPDRRMPD